MAPSRPPCGTARDGETFYCGDGENIRGIYINHRLIAEAQQWWRLRIAQVVAHEYFHHVQSVAGIQQARWRLVERGMDKLEFTRRSELQTRCYQSRALLLTKPYRFSRNDYQVVVQWTKDKGSKTHGSSQSAQHWLIRGFYAQTLASCNTWTAPASWVT